MNLVNLINKTSEIQFHEKQCTQSLLNEWKYTLPLFKQKILLNCHLTIAILMIVELLLMADAELKMAI